MANYCVYSGGNGTSGAVAGSVPTATEWSNAYQSLSACLTAITEAAGDTIFVAHDHVAAYAASTTVTFAQTGEVNVLSIDRTNTTTATLLAGGKEYTNGNFALTYTGQFNMHGMTLQAATGSTSSVANIVLGNYTAAGTLCLQNYTNCTFYLNTTNATPSIKIASFRGNDESAFKFENCVFQFANAVNRISTSTSAIQMLNCSLAGTAPTTLFVVVEQYASDVTLNGCSFSSPTNLISVATPVPNKLKATNCTVPSSITTGTHGGQGTSIIERHACSSADHTYDY